VLGRQILSDLVGISAGLLPPVAGRPQENDPLALLAS
jgi:hypothetical protein